jgi:hypothetical protein
MTISRFNCDINLNGVDLGYTKCAFRMTPEDIVSVSVGRNHVVDTTGSGVLICDPKKFATITRFMLGITKEKRKVVYRDRKPSTILKAEKRRKNV